MFERIFRSRTPEAEEEAQNFAYASIRYEFLQQEILKLEEVKKRNESYNPQDKAEIIQNRIVSFRDSILKLRKEPVPLTQRVLWINDDCFYNLNNGQVFRAPSQLVFGDIITGAGFMFYPHLTKSESVDPLDWCLNLEIVTALSDKLVRLVPPPITERILSKAS